MLSRRRLSQLAAVLLVAGFCLGLVKLFQLRFSTGDVFPPYSALRADPLGTRIFYESLRSLPGIIAGRNERQLDNLGHGAGAVIFLFGAKSPYFSEKEKRATEHFLNTGGRLVVTFFPRYGAPPKDTTGSPTPAPSPSMEPKPTPRGVSLESMLAQWEIGTDSDPKVEADIATRENPSPLEETLSWYSGVFFRPKSPAWHTIYRSERGPVVVERSIGEGSIVLASDSYFVSNEALLVERAPACLSWLVGPARHVIFEETHLNFHEQPGVASLLRRHGLSGFVIGFLVLIALWLWRNATFTLAPRRDAPPSDEIVSGRDSFAGFVHLLRRGPAPAELLGVCLTEWSKSARSPDNHRARNASALSAAIENEKNPVTAYNTITEMLRAKKWKPTN